MTATQYRATTPITKPRRLATRSVKALPVPGYIARYTASALPLPTGAPVYTVPDLVGGIGDLAAPSAAYTPAVTGTPLYIENTASRRVKTPDDVVSLAAYTLVAVARVDSAPTGTGTIVGTGSSNANIGVFGGKIIANSGTLLNGPDLDANTHVLIFSATGTALSALNVDGVDYEGNAGVNPLTEIRTFNGSATDSNTNYARGRIYDIAVYPFALSAAERAKVSAHLRSEYGL